MSRSAGLVATLAATVAAGLVVSACGSTALSASQLRSFATRSCDQARKRTDEIPTPVTPDGGASFLSRGVAALEPEQKTLASLQPPQTLRTDYNAAVSASGQELAALRLTLARLRGGADPVTSIKDLQRRLTPLERRADTAWHALDVPGCAVR
ncbi:MAG: hypothetical protein WAK93_13950 [Solirubrobacteraceae bacterium]